MVAITRRAWLQGAAALALTSRMWADKTAVAAAKVLELPHARPAVGARHFTSEAVEAAIQQVKSKIPDVPLATIFENCFPNTLDTTVFPGSYEGKPDTYVVTGDIDAMWLRDSSAQVRPYLALANQDARLRKLLEGVMRRQARLMLIDPYANAFMRDTTSVRRCPGQCRTRRNTIPGWGSASGRWIRFAIPSAWPTATGKRTGDTGPFDAQWKEAAWTIVRTFRTQQRKQGRGPYSFQRESETPTDTLALDGYGNPAIPVGMIFSMFRPSDDACTYPFLFPQISLRW